MISFSRFYDMDHKIMAKILLVDDNPTNIQVLQYALSSEQHELYQSKNGIIALEMAKQIHPDLILLDVIMPGLDGFEVCRKLKMDITTADIIVIFVSSRHEEIDKLNGLELGAADYITKPFSIDELVARVRVHLQLREKQVLLQEHRLQDQEYFRRINDIKVDVINQIKHDLKQPITSILTNTYVIQKHFSSGNTALELCLHRIELATNEILQMVDNLLEVVKLETGRAITKQPVQVWQFITDIVALFEPVAAAKSIALHCDLSAISANESVEFDRIQMRRVIENLIGNAIKFNVANGSVNLHVWLTEVNMMIEVSDTGRGIPSADLDKIFQRFYRVSDESDYAEGTGLGLYIVKSIVEQHGGTISVESKPREGSRFSITIPNM